MEKAKIVTCMRCGKTFLHPPIYQEDKYDELCEECLIKEELENN
jgi:DNA-directed RNA polymerase subunit RPC12/RpoP